MDNYSESQPLNNDIEKLSYIWTLGHLICSQTYWNWIVYKL